MRSIRTEACHVSHSREFVGTVCRNFGQSNTTNTHPICGGCGAFKTLIPTLYYYFITITQTSDHAITMTS